MEVSGYIYFENGKATSSDSGAVSTERQGGLNKVRVGASERFEIPDAVIVGG